MEMRRENNNEKRRRKVINKGPILVRSAKPGTSSVQSWQRDSGASFNLWRNMPAA